VKTLSIDIGNTRIRAGVIDNQLIDPSFHSPLAGGADRVAELFDWCVGQIESDPEIESVALCSVVDTATQLWSHLVQGKARIRELHWIHIDHRSPKPFSVDVEAPETVGADRYANVAGACARGLDTALVVDLGTANTYDLLVDRRFRGGLIAPGCTESHQRLVERGSALPNIPFVHNPSLVGRNTREAIEAGSFRQALAGVSGVIDTLLTEVRDMPVLLTGGLAEILGPELSGHPLYLPDLTLEGAAEIARCARIP
jgi:type III pantothenate kinase